MEDGVPKYVKIGEWIDQHLENDKESVKHFEERQMEMLYIKNEAYIPTMDYDGVVTWGELTAVTRHDPGTELYQIKTSGGKSVIVTESKSLLTWNKELGQFKEVSTPEIKVGDYVPVTAKLMEPPVLVREVDMAQYFPKMEYIHGSEFNKARRSMDVVMEGRKKVPTGWWKENNGSSFVLPYSSKAKLARVVARSNTENIKDGCVYPFHATREHSLMPDKFELNYENGVFVGLFLSEGHSREKSGTVSITNCDISVRTFAKEWFNKYAITNREETKVNHIGGTSTSIIGSSTLLARFLDSFVGKTAYAKHVPDVAFVAPEEFVVGVLNGYFSGDGSIGKNSVEAGSASARLMEGISMLCTRLGIFGKVFMTQTKTNNLGTKNIAPSHRIAIRAQWAKLFASKVKLLVKSKQQQLDELHCTDCHSNFQEHNDVVLDEIVEISLVDISKHPKVYDLTIPSTLNFGLANGLQVRDTSETGYIQRRLVKAMEDCKVYYDQTVRNATGSVVQFLYGEDGMDGTKVEQHSIPYVKSDFDFVQMDAKFHLRKSDPLERHLSEKAKASMKTEGDWSVRCDKLYEEMLEDKDFLITQVFKFAMEDKIVYPIPFARLIAKAAAQQGQVGLAGLPTDLTPVQILDKMDELKATLFVTQKDQGVRFMHILLRLYLNPKVILMEKTLHKPAFDWVCSEIVRCFKEALVQPGEMVGVVAAQSIGEPATQLTLNSVEWHTEMLMKIEGNIQRIKMGAFVDAVVEASKEEDMEHHPNDTVLAWIKDKKVEVLACTEEGKIIWDNVQAVTRHPVVNKDGSNTLLKVKLHSGREVTATKAKSFLKRVDNKIVQVNGEDIRVGDYIPVANKLKTETAGVTHWNLSDSLPATEWLYMSQVAKGLQYIDEHQWWHKHHGKDFTVPYKRSDSFLCAFVGDKARRVVNTQKDNCVYPLHMLRQPAHVPEQLPLDNVTGFFIGAYLSEGCCTEHHILISNTDDDFLSNIDEFCNRYDIKYHFDERKDERGHTKTLRMHCMVLAQLLLRTIGTGSHNKRIPAFMLDAPNEFLMGLVDGYFSGDGTVSKRDNVVKATSVSEGLLHDIQQILAVFNIQTTVRAVPSQYENAKKKFTSVYMPYELNIPPAMVERFGDNFKLTIGNKQSRLEEKISLHEFCRYDKVPDIVTATWGTITISRNEIRQRIAETSNKEDQLLLESILNEDIMYDQIVEIEEVVSDYEYVYDFTVEKTKNFNTYTGICMADTFHLSGTASASKATRGVPRLKELLSVSKNIKGPMMTIHLQPDVAPFKDRATDMKNRLEITRVKDILDSTEIYWDPPGATGLETGVQGDDAMLAIYRAFQDAQQCGKDSSPWVLRMKFDKEKMYRGNLRMIDIYMRVLSTYARMVECAFTDDNADELIFRVRLTEAGLKDVDAEDAVAALKAVEHNIVHNILLKGIQGIEAVSMRNDKRERYSPVVQKFESSDNWILETDGSSLADTFAIPNVDATKTISNDIWEIYHTLGIEAARNALFNEIYEVIRESSVNFRHISLLIDTMSCRGSLMSIDRHGINRGDVGPLAKSSFEETTDMLINAGIFSETDKINGVSANIMLGQLPPCGTGDSEILLDEERLMELLAGEVTKKKAADAVERNGEIEVSADLPAGSATENMSCTIASLSFEYELPEPIKNMKLVAPKVVFGN